MCRVLGWIILTEVTLVFKTHFPYDVHSQAGLPNGLENSLCIMKLCNTYYGRSFFKGYGLLYEAMRITEEYGVVHVYRRSVKHCKT